MASRLAIRVGAEWISMNLTSWLALHWARSASASRSCFMNASAALRPSSSGLARPKFGSFHTCCMVPGMTVTVLPRQRLGRWPASQMRSVVSARSPGKGSSVPSIHGCSPSRS